MKREILYGDTDSFMPLYPRAMRSSLGMGKMTFMMFLAMRTAYQQMLSGHPLDPDNLEACRKCLEKHKGPNISCDRYVQCMIGADETSEYVRSTSVLLKKLAVVFNIKDVPDRERKRAGGIK